METIWHDEGYRARGNIVNVEDDDCGSIGMHGIIPHFLDRPGEVRWAGAALGEHTRDVLVELAGVEEDEIPRLREEGVI
jgi:crotonobetainyl-CoA:carnitine CoA-transferase CaiB-like acyl-CoA transferase